MESLYFLIEGVVAVLVICSLVYNYKKYRASAEAKIDEVKLLVNSSREQYFHMDKQLLDLIKVNREELADYKRIIEERLGIIAQLNEQRMEDFKNTMEDRLAALQKKTD